MKKKRAASTPTSSRISSSGTISPARLLIADLLAAAHQRHLLHDCDVEPLRIAKRGRHSLEAFDITVMVGAQNVDDAVVALQLLIMIGDVHAKIGRPPVAAQEHAILVVAELRCTKEECPVLLVREPERTQAIDAFAHLAALVQLALRSASDRTRRRSVAPSAAVARRTRRGRTWRNTATTRPPARRSIDRRLARRSAARSGSDIRRDSRLREADSRYRKVRDSARRGIARAHRAVRPHR